LANSLTVSKQMLLCSVFFHAASRTAIFFLNRPILLSLHGTTLKSSCFSWGYITPIMRDYQPSTINFFLNNVQPLNVKR